MTPYGTERLKEFRRLLASRGIVREDSGSVVNTVAVLGALAATVVIVALSSARLEPETVAALVAFATHPVILGGIVSAAFLSSAVRRLRS